MQRIRAGCCPRARGGWRGGAWRLAALVALAAPGAQAQYEPDEEPPAALHERLTEREDESRLENPTSFDVGGRPLYLSGQVELSFDWLERHRWLDDEEGGFLLMEPEVEAEAFYSFGAPLSLFVQVRAAAEEDLIGAVSNRFVERGEMWLSSVHPGSGLMLEVGRLDFEDDRLWWWDGDLDALRLSHERGDVEIALALARELAADRSDRDEVEPEHDHVQRLILEASWDWSENHTLQLFGLRHRDGSRTEDVGDLVASDDVDESDADLLWYGLRAAGAWNTTDGHLLGYWLDAARVRGDERRLDFAPDDDENSLVEESAARRVRGWAWDAGATWLLPLPHEPRFSVGYARGSGDPDPDDDVDRSFRQTGLHGNEIGFGGVQRFARYGEALEPELSNLAVFTAGVGISLQENSSLDLVYHRYRLLEFSDELRDARIEAELTGEHRDLGDALELVLAVEEWQRFELELSAAAFRPGAAFGDHAGDWLMGGFLAFRWAF